MFAIAYPRPDVIQRQLERVPGGDAVPLQVIDRVPAIVASGSVKTTPRHTYPMAECSLSFTVGVHRALRNGGLVGHRVIFSMAHRSLPSRIVAIDAIARPGEDRTRKSRILA